MSADLEKLLAEATPGPWNVTQPLPSSPEWFNIAHGDYGWTEDGTSYLMVHGTIGEPNARLIALTPDLARQVIALTADNAALRAKAEKLAEALRDVMQDYGAQYVDAATYRECADAATAALTEWETP